MIFRDSSLCSLRDPFTVFILSSANWLLSPKVYVSWFYFGIYFHSVSSPGLLFCFCRESRLESVALHLNLAFPLPSRQLSKESTGSPSFILIFCLRAPACQYRISTLLISDLIWSFDEADLKFS